MGLPIGIAVFAESSIFAVIALLIGSLGATVVMVTHELASIFAIGTNSIFLDPETKTAIAAGPPRQLLAESTDERVLRFLTRDNPQAESTRKEAIS